MTFMVVNLWVGQVLFFDSASHLLILSRHFAVTTLGQDYSQVHISASLLILGVQ